MASEERWKLVIEASATVITGLSLIASVLIYLHGQEQALRTEQALIDTREARAYARRQWDERLASYQRLAASLGGIAAEIELEQPVSEASLSEFHSAYWGTMLLVESEAVGLEMLRLKNDLRDLEAGRIDGDRVKLRIEQLVGVIREHVESR